MEGGIDFSATSVSLQNADSSFSRYEDFRGTHQTSDHLSKYDRYFNNTSAVLDNLTTPAGVSVKIADTSLHIVHVTSVTESDFNKLSPLHDSFASVTVTDGPSLLTSSHLEANSILHGMVDTNITENQTDFTTLQFLARDGFSPTEKIVIAGFLSVIIILAIVGNLLVCVAILTERSLRKSSNYFYVSLAVADLLVASVVMSFAVANDIMGHWVFSPIFCNIWLSADVMCSTASILNLCAISLDRFLHIKDPYNYEGTMTHRKTLLFIAIIWLLSGLISFLPIHLGWHKTQDYNQYIAGQFICLLDLNPIYAVSSSLVSFYVPCVIMIAIYAKLYQYARRHVKSIKRNSTWSAISNVALDPRIHPHHHYKPTDQKAAITLGVIMGTFLFCWMPFFAINVITALCSNCVDPLLFNVFTWLGYINSVANPIIYPVFNKEFRTAFKRILFCPGGQHSQSYRDGTRATQSTSDRLLVHSTLCCPVACFHFSYNSVHLNGKSVPTVTSPCSPEHERSSVENDIVGCQLDGRKHSESPLIGVQIHSSVTQTLNLDRVTVV